MIMQHRKLCYLVYDQTSQRAIESEKKNDYTSKKSMV